MNLEQQVRLNENESKILGVLDLVTREHGDLCVAFDYLIGETKLERAIVRRACRSLRSKGLAEFYRGLVTEDGEMAGSGYCISRAGQVFLRPCMNCKSVPAVMDDGRCQECWEKRPCSKCGKAYQDHELKGGYMQEFEFVVPKNNAFVF